MYKFTLHKGLKIGDEENKEVTLRELTAGDVIAAMEESERVVMRPTASGTLEPVLLLSNSLMSINTLRRQIAKIGNINGPLERDMLDKLSDIDLGLLQDKVSELDKAVAKEIDDRGRAGAASQDDGGTD